VLGGLPMAMRFALRFACLGMLIATPAVAHAADNDVSGQLTGTSSREWVYRRIVSMMGSGDACTEGEVYTFSKNGILTIRLCVDHHLTSTQHKWTLTSAPNGDSVLSIDGTTTYVLLFSSDKSSNRFMHLRTKNIAQTEPVIDKVFELNEE
jgi:hypothetical protein